MSGLRVAFYDHCLAFQCFFMLNKFKCDKKKILSIFFYWIETPSWKKIDLILQKNKFFIKIFTGNCLQMKQNYWLIFSKNTWKMILNWFTVKKFIRKPSQLQFQLLKITRHSIKCFSTFQNNHFLNNLLHWSFFRYWNKKRPYIMFEMYNWTWSLKCWNMKS